MTILCRSGTGITAARTVFSALLAQEKASAPLALVSLVCGFSGKQKAGTFIARLADQDQNHFFPALSSAVLA